MGEKTKDPLLQKIWTRRKFLRLSQAEVAKKLGLQQRAYSAMESGENRMYAEYLPKIAKILDISISELLSENDPKIGPLNNKEKAHILELRDISRDDERLIVFNLAKSLAEQSRKKSHG